MAGTNSGYQVRQTISVTDIKCSSCEKLITDGLMKLDGVYEVKPDHRTGKVVVSYDLLKTQLVTLEEKLDALGYPLLSGFWVRCKRDLDHFKERNARDNMSHAPHCCNKPPLQR